MALFSRRPKRQPDEPAETPQVETPGTTADVTPEGTDAAASVGISVSAFRGLGTPDPAPAPAAAARPTGPDAAAATQRPAETIPGLRDNVLLRESLARLPEKPTPEQVLDLARQVLQGHLFLRVKGDARALIAEGKELPLAIANAGDRQYAIAYSSGAGLAASVRADGDADTSAMGQPAMVVLRHVLASTTAGLVIDPASAPARIVLPRPLIERMLAAVDEKLAIKTLLADERTDATPAAVADAMTRAPMWVAVNRSEDGAPVGIAEGRAPDGSRYVEVYSHPLEVVATGRGDQAAPLTAPQLAAMLAADESLAGAIIDPRGPWIRLSRGDLAPVLALAP
ncbi:SseB family protein [Microbacterium sp. NPDC055910]|uniref:SseB family protein n=1 Tax=Microbacterium sp. NPDC055910 TaxID=3345659 RepID=UPI0035DC6AC1